MPARKSSRLSVEILNESTTLTLSEVCRSCGADSHFVYELVQEGVIRPRGKRVHEWVFDGIAVTRIQRAYRMHRDLQVNLPGIALALELLDRMEQIRRR